MATAETEAQKPFSIEDFKGKTFAGARENYSDLIAKAFPKKSAHDTKSKTMFRKSIKLRKLSKEAATLIVKAENLADL